MIIRNSVYMNNTRTPASFISTIKNTVENFTNMVDKNKYECDENDITILEKIVISNVPVFIGNDGRHYDPLIYEIILKIIHLKKIINSDNVFISDTAAEEIIMILDNITLIFSKYYSWFELICPEHFQKYIHSCVNKNYKEIGVSLKLLMMWLENRNPDKPCLLTEDIFDKDLDNSIDAILEKILLCLKTHNAHVSYNNVTHTKYNSELIATDLI